MKLITSAGSYVKEFIHSDLNRTKPSISSLLQCKTDILQLDVVGLFDTFQNGYEHNQYVMNELNENENNNKNENENEQQKNSNEVFNEMKTFKIAKWKHESSNK